jgi:hypothetical protein
MFFRKGRLGRRWWGGVYDRGVFGYGEGVFG